MPNFKVTFVTAFFELNEVRPNEKPLQSYIKHFISLAYSAIPLCLYTSSDIAKMIIDADPNIFSMSTIKLYIVSRDTTISQLIMSYNNLQLPANRNSNKDTYKYMILINSKVEYLHRAIMHNPFNTSHFAWIDFGIFHIIKGNIETVQQRLYQIATTSYKIGSLIIPGCWQRKDMISKKDFIDNINWRFCGGFLLGCTEEITRFYNSYLTQLKIFLDTFGVLVWEVNFWAWLEREAKITVDWYLADHNDYMFNIPYSFIADNAKALPDGLRNRLKGA